MKTDTALMLLVLGVGAYLVWTRMAAETPSGTDVVLDAGWNYPPIYPEETGSGSVDPMATWPGWATPPYVPQW